MSKKPNYARIAITLPPETLAAADRLAREADRSRSWVIAEAVRRFAATWIGPSRIEQLRRDMRLTPEAGVRVAEAMAPIASAGSRYAQLVAAGVIRPAIEGGDPFADFPSLRLPPGTAAELIDAEREER